jgi:hypothetical protein
MPPTPSSSNHLNHGNLKLQSNFPIHKMMNPNRPIINAGNSIHNSSSFNYHHNNNNNHLNNHHLRHHHQHPNNHHLNSNINNLNNHYDYLSDNETS